MRSVAPLLAARSARRLLALACVALLLLAAVPAPVAAQETRSGDRIVVGPDETIDGDLTAFGGTIVVRGTVNGDLDAFGGNVLVTGTVTGDVSAVAGNVRIEGDVGGSVDANGGNVELGRDATVGGNFRAGAGNVVLAGTVRGDAEADAGTVVLAESAVVEGDLRYGGELVDQGGAVRGRVVQEPAAGGAPFPLIPGWAFRLYGALVTLLVGAILLAAFPEGTRNVADRVRDSPLRTGGAGILALVGVPVLLVLLALSIVGIPLTVAGFVLYGVGVWLAGILGRYAVGAWLLSLADTDNRWLALLVGVAALYLVGFVPFLGEVAGFLVMLLGLGAMALVGRDAYRRRRERRAAEGAPQDTDGAAEAT